MQRFFRVTPPAVHQMLLTLEQAGLISRTPGAARAIAIQVDRSQLPAPQPGYAQTVKSTVQRY
jgi:SOS-response transcriptional repressor LexA